MPGQIDPAAAALYAIIAVVLVLLGAVMVAPDIPIEQRASAVAAMVATLGAVAWRGRRDRA